MSNKTKKCEGTDGELDCTDCLNPCSFELRKRMSHLAKTRREAEKAEAELKATLARIDAGNITEEEKRTCAKLVAFMDKRSV